MNHSLHNWRHLMHSPCALFAYRYVYLAERGWDSISDCLFISFWLLRLIKFACEGNAWLPSTIEDCVGMRMRNRSVRAFLRPSLWTPCNNEQRLKPLYHYMYKEFAKSMGLKFHLIFFTGWFWRSDLVSSIGNKRFTNIK